MTTWNKDFHDVVAYFMKECGTSSTLIVDDGTGTYVNSEWIPNIATIPCRILPFDYIRKTEGIGENSNTLVMSGDKQIYVQPSTALQTIDPVFTKIVLNGYKCKIVTVKNLNPTMNDSVLFEMYVRVDNSI